MNKEVVTLFLNDSVYKYTRGGDGRAPKKGHLWGLELELEGRGLLPPNLKGWTPHQDGSLRNNHGEAIEWVTAQPYKFDTVIQRVDNLFQGLADNKAKIITSNRTSTHVHYNMGDKQNFQVLSLYVVFTCVEGLLGRYCGDERDGNLFCLSSRNANNLVEMVSRAVFRHCNWFDFTAENRYASLNLSSLNKFGTVEFRSMRGLDNGQAVKDWMNILKELIDYSLERFEGPEKFVTSLSERGCGVVLKDIFPDTYPLLVEGLSDHDVHSSMWEGMRLVQMICYKAQEVWDGIKKKGPDFWDQKAEKLLKEELPEPDFDAIFDEAPEPEPRPRARGVGPLPPRPGINEQLDQIARGWGAAAGPNPVNIDFAGLEQRVINAGVGAGARAVWNPVNERWDMQRDVVADEQPIRQKPVRPKVVHQSRLVAQRREERYSAQDGFPVRQLKQKPHFLDPGVVIYYYEGEVPDAF